MDGHGQGIDVIGEGRHDFSVRCMVKIGDRQRKHVRIHLFSQLINGALRKLRQPKKTIVFGDGCEGKHEDHLSHSKEETMQIMFYSHRIHDGR